MRRHLSLVEAPRDDAVLHAYLDGELDPAERRGVEAWLADNPGIREKIDAWREQIMDLHRLAAQERLTPMPPEMAQAGERLRARCGKRRRRLSDLRIAATVVLALGAGALAATGTGIFREDEGASMRAFARQAVLAHRDYAEFAEAKVPADGAAAVHFVARLAAIAEQPPDLSESGFDVAMHRILPRPDGSAAQILYASEDGRRVTLYIGPAQPGGDRQFTVMRDGRMSTLYWQGSDVAFSLIGSLDDATMLALAGTVTAEIDLPATPGGRKGGGEMAASGAKEDAVVPVGSSGKAAAPGASAPGTLTEPRRSAPAAREIPDAAAPRPGAAGEVAGSDGESQET